MRIARLLLLVGAVAGLLRDAAAQDDPPPEPARLTVADTFELVEQVRPDWPRSLGWLDGRTWLAHDVPAKGADKTIVKVDALTGELTPLFSTTEMIAAFGRLSGVTEEDARAWSTRGTYPMSKQRDAILLNEKRDLFFHRFGSGVAHRLTRDPEEEVGETISPDGTMVAYVSEHDLHVVAADGGTPRALTSEGSEDLLMGRLDWVYQEEIYGRGNWQGYWWSPDSSRIAFLALDQSPVPSYTIVDHRDVHPEVQVWRYPKAGDPNPTVRVGVLDVGGGEPVWIDLSRYGGQEILVVRVGWTPDGAAVILQVQNRVQTWLDLLSCDPQTGAVRRLFRDATDVWIEPSDAPFFTADGGRFLWLSERDGWRHLYLYDRDGNLLRRLTAGGWEVDEVHGIDDAAGRVWFSGDQGDVKGSKLFTVGLDGAEPTLVTERAGTHDVAPSPTFEFFLDEFSSVADPGWVALFRADGRLVRVVGEGSAAPLEKYGLRAPELVTLKTRDGFVMEGMLIRPPDFEEGRRYPVLMHAYGGPHAPQVRDRYLNRALLWHQMLAQHGIVVFICDNRSASGRGLAATRDVHHRLGVQELADLEDAADWLVAEGLAEPDRIALWGWSYGGYMTAFALTHSTKFRAGIAGAPVTDWRLYDSIYTERYMGLPQTNPEGYAASSVLEAAEHLHGDLLLIHGTIDENVHLQNTLQLAQKLQEAGKRFDLMLYPGNRHAVTDKKQRLHLYRTMADWLLERL